MTDAPSYAYASKPHPCETVCGDQHVVVNTDGGLLVGLADGLGHGSAAAQAARAFCDFIALHAHDARQVEELIADSSHAVAGTRGAAVALVFVAKDGAHMSFSGIGNVELQAVSREKITPVSLPGIVGRHVRKTKRFDYAIHSGDFFVMYSDGISSRFDPRPYAQLELQAAADQIVERHRTRTNDDATCIVFRI
jgi:serine/threonine protein phosphatase PrpC